MRNKKKIIICVIVVIVLGGIIALVNIISAGSRDENVEKYKESLNESILGDVHHFKLLDSVTGIDGNFLDEYCVEEYRIGKEYLRIDTSSSSVGEHHTFCYNGYTYNLSTGDENIHISKHEEISTTTPTPNGVGYAYYSIHDKNVTYEENESNWIVTYDNKSLIGRPINGVYWEEDKDGYTSAISVAYFDKEWNLERLEITEKWTSITEEGQEYERIRKIEVIYYDTTEEEMKNIFEKEYNMLEEIWDN